jgi:hypothetical protein
MEVYNQLLLIEANSMTSIVDNSVMVFLVRIGCGASRASRRLLWGDTPPTPAICRHSGWSIGKGIFYTFWPEPAGLFSMSHCHLWLPGSVCGIVTDICAVIICFSRVRLPMSSLALAQNFSAVAPST